jgi:carboxyl-terminal processing protease
LHIGDKILEVAQKGEKPVDVVEMRINKIVNLIRGEAGTEVTLTVQTADGSSHKITLTRDEVRISEGLASAQVVEVPDPIGKSTIAIGVIALPSFYAGTDDTATTTDDLKELIGKLDGMNVRGLVLDLRNNGGGLLSEAIGVVGLFVPSAPVVQVRSGNGGAQVRWNNDGKVFYGGPLVVLTSRMSASASEIVAGALQSLNRAIIVGDHATHGKGTVQTIFETDKNLLAKFTQSPPAGGIKVTIQKFYLPDGASTQNKGVLSDIALPSINDALPLGESDIPHALPWDQIPTARWSYREGWEGVDRLDSKTRNYLVEESQKRMENLPELIYLKDITEHAKMRYEQKQKWLNYDLRSREKKLDEKFKQTSEARRLELAKNNYASADVLLDIDWKLKAEHQAKLQQTPLPDGRARAGNAYENVYYYSNGDEIREIRADSIDYEAIGDYTDQLAVATGLTPDKIGELINQFKLADERAEFNINEIFAKTLGPDWSSDQVAEIVHKFFEQLIVINPALSSEHPNFDIPLREALRVAADWAGVKHSAIFEPAQTAPLAQTH